jgi:hypothetical protein
VSNRDDFLTLMHGRRPDRIPSAHYGFWDERAMHKLAPADCWDENTLTAPSDDPQRDRFSPEPRTDESRERAIRMARHLDTALIGVGKGGVTTFGHGGPGEIQPEVVERSSGGPGGRYKIQRYEGGHKRMVHYDPHSIRFYDFPVRGAADLDRLELPDMRDPVRFQDIAADAKAFKDAGFVPTGSIQGFFSGIHNSFMEFSTTMENLLLEPGLMRRLTERLARMSLDAAVMYLERGVEVIDVCDDLGNADGLLLSPRLFGEFFLPWYAELVATVHARGGWVHLHSHGNIAPVLDQLTSVGIDIINPFDWNENPDLPALVRKFSDRVVFCGGLVGDLYRYPTAEVERIAKRACGLSALAERGYLFMGFPGMEELSVEQWNEWRSIFRRAREGGGRT